jgi:biotin synthase-related radical SAM superfamily protein
MKKSTVLFREYLSNYIEFYKKINGYTISQDRIDSINRLLREALMLSKDEKVPVSLIMTLGEELSGLYHCFTQENTLFGAVKIKCLDPKRANILMNNIEISIRQIDLL